MIELVVSIKCIYLVLGVLQILEITMKKKLINKFLFSVFQFVYSSNVLNNQ